MDRIVTDNTTHNNINNTVPFAELMRCWKASQLGRITNSITSLKTWSLSLKCTPVGPVPDRRSRVTEEAAAKLVSKLVRIAVLERQEYVE